MTDTNSLSRIPEFQTREEEAKFWDSHSILDFPESITSIEVVRQPKGKVKDEILAIRLT